MIGITQGPGARKRPGLLLCASPAPGYASAAPMRWLLAILCLAGAAQGSPRARKASRSDVAGTPRSPPARPDVSTPIPSAGPAQPVPPTRAAPQQAVPRKFGRFDLDMPFAQVRAMPDLADCAKALAAPAGHAECALPRGPDNLARVQLAWEESRCPALRNSTVRWFFVAVATRGRRSEEGGETGVTRLLSGLM